jgi:hypothetical protein
MKIGISFLAALVLIGTSLLTRMAAQGVEQLILSTAIALNRIRGGIRPSPRSGWNRG